MRYAKQRRNRTLESEQRTRARKRTRASREERNGKRSGKRNGNKGVRWQQFRSWARRRLCLSEMWDESTTSGRQSV